MPGWQDAPPVEDWEKAPVVAEPKQKPKSGGGVPGIGGWGVAGVKAIEGYGQYALDQVANAPESIANVARGFGQMIAHPIDTLDNAALLIEGETKKLGRAVHLPPIKPRPNAAQADATATQFNQRMADRYGSPKKVIETFRTDPAGAALDASAVAGGVASSARRAGVAGLDEAAAVSRVPPIIRPPAARMAQAKGFGIDLSIGDARGMGAKAIERNLDTQPGSAGFMEAAREKLRQQLPPAVDKVAESYGPATSFVGMGEAAQTGARSWLERFSGENGVVGKLYKAIPIKNETPVATTNTQSLLRTLTERTPSNEELNRLLAEPQFARYLDALAGKTEQVATGVLDEGGKPIMKEVTRGGNLSWQDLKTFRSDVGDMTTDSIIGGNGPRKSQLKRLYGALSQDMETAARASGPEALRKFQRANDTYAAGQARIENVLTKLLGKDDSLRAEAAAGLIQRLAKEGKSSADIRTLGEIKKSLPPENWGEVSNGIIRLMGQPANAAGREFQPDIFVRNYADMAPDAKSLLFGSGEIRAKLDSFAEVMGYLAKSKATRNTSNTSIGIGGSVTSGIGAGIGASAMGIPGAIMGAIGTQLGYAKAAQLWTNPRFIEWATGFTRTVKSRNPSAMRASINRLGKLGKQIGEERLMLALAQNMSGVLEKAMNDNGLNATVGAAASGETPEDQRQQQTAF